MWTPELEQQARELWENTELSGSQIAQRLGLKSRCMVIGRAHMRKWKKRVQKKAQPNPPKQPPPLRRELISKPIAVDSAPAIPAPALVPTSREGETALIHIGPRQCRWPTRGEGAALMCCGMQTARGSIYCDTHREIAWAPDRRHEKEKR